MRALKIYVVSVLVTICTLLPAAYAQTSNARPATEASGGQDASPKPTNPEESDAQGTAPGAASNPPAIIPTRPIPGSQVTPAGSAAADQNSPPTALPGQSALPEDVLFELFFNNMSALNQVADKDEKAGDHTWAAAWRTHDQKAAGLNDAEGQLLQEITLDCLRMLKEQDAKFRAAAEKFRAQLKSGAPILIPQELVQMDEDRKRIVTDHIGRLREALGDASFNKLDTYVHSTFHVEMVVPKPAPTSSSVVEKRPEGEQVINRSFFALFLAICATMLAVSARAQVSVSSHTNIQIINNQKRIVPFCQALMLDTSTKALYIDASVVCTLNQNGAIQTVPACFGNPVAFCQPVLGTWVTIIKIG